VNDVSLRATVEKAFAAFAAGDVDAAIAHFTPDVVMTEGGANVRTGEYRGPEDIKAFLQRLSDETDGSFTATAQAVTGDDTMAASVAHAAGWRRGRHLDTHVVTLFAGADGLISSIRDLPFDWRAWDEFWSA
jgi:ketosteroid isomerase-like protein